MILKQVCQALGRSQVVWRLLSCDPPPWWDRYSICQMIHLLFRCKHRVCSMKRSEDDFNGMHRSVLEARRRLLGVD